MVAVELATYSANKLEAMQELKVDSSVRVELILGTRKAEGNPEKSDR